MTNKALKKTYLTGDKADQEAYDFARKIRNRIKAGKLPAWSCDTKGRLFIRKKKGRQFLKSNPQIRGISKRLTQFWHVVHLMVANRE